MICIRSVFVLLMVTALLPVGRLRAENAALDSYIREALAVNPGAQAAWHRVEAARAALKQARSAYYPRLSAAASYTMTDNPPQAFMMDLNQRRLDMASPTFDPNNPDDTENVRVSLALKYRLYDGQRGARTGMARLGERVAACGHEAARNALIHEVTRGYYQVLQAQDFVVVREQSLKSLEESLRVARERFEAGSAFKTDVLNLEVQVAQATEDLIRARNGVKLAVAALNTAVGKDLVPAEGIAAPKMPPAPTVCVAGPEGDAIDSRAELRLSELMMRIAELTYKKSRRERGPIVNAYGSMDWDGEDLSDQEQSYLAGIALEWEWFSGFQDAAAVDQARREWQAAQQEHEQTRNQLRLDLRQASLAVQEACERLGVARKSVSSAEEALRITRERYQQGSADITVLLMSEVALSATRTRDTAATYDYQVAVSNLDRARGKLAKQYTEEGAQ
jgi:outer membrane protein